MRPLYENQNTLDREREVAQFLGGRWNCEFVKLPMQYRVDFAAVRDGSVVAFVEIKGRGRQYPQMFLSLQKYLHGRQLAEFLDVPFLIVYAFADGSVHMRKTTDEKPKVAIGGRTDRGDWQDVEPQALINLSDCSVLRQAIQ